MPTKKNGKILCLEGKKLSVYLNYPHAKLIAFPGNYNPLYTQNFKYKHKHVLIAVLMLTYHKNIKYKEPENKTSKALLIPAHI